MGYTQDSSTGQLIFNTNPSTVADLDALSRRVEEASTSEVVAFSDLAAIAYPRPSQLVWVTSEQLVYRYDAGGWTPLVYDTGWSALGLAGGIAVNGGAPSVQRERKTVTFKGSIKSTGTFTANTSGISLLALAYPLPTWARPKQTRDFPVAGHNGASGCRASVYTDGTMTLDIGAVVPAFVSLDNINYWVG